MFKFAFIENVPGTSPETYSLVYENEESYNLVVGTGSYEMTEDLVKKLDSEGVSIINLCGDFDAAAVGKLSKVVKNDIKIRYADYFPGEMKKMEALQSMKEYGIIVVTKGVQETENFTLKDEQCNTYVSFTKDLEMAKEAAKDLVGRGVDFIELCSYFDKDKTEAIIDAIGGEVPVGSCGEL